MTEPRQINGLEYLKRARGENALGIEKIKNGDFNSAANWDDASIGTGTAVISGGKLTVTRVNAQNRGSRAQTVTGLVPGATYRISGVIDTSSGFVSFDNQGGNMPVGNFSFNIVASGASTTLFLECVGDNTTTGFDNISAKRI